MRDIQTTEKQLIYLYCVTEKEPELKEAKVSVNDLHFVYNKGFYAVVGKVEESEFSEQNLKKNLADLEWVKTNARMHERIIEEIMAYTIVIPFKFGTLFNTDDSLKAMLEEYGEEFKTILKRLENNQEWGVKIYYDTEKLRQTLINGNARLLEIENEITSSSAGKAYFLNKKKDELIKDMLNKEINECGQGSFELLKGLSVEARINKLLPKEVTDRKENMILNSAFLVNKNELDDFINMVNTLKAYYEEEGFSIDCTGPWPPYNFCRLPKEKVQSG